MAYYSIIFASLRKETQEKVSLGFVMFDDKQVLCKFSKTKLSGLRQLLSKDEFRLVNEAMVLLEKKVRFASGNYQQNYHSLFTVTDPSFSMEYISYLSRYRNNLVTYTPPKLIDVPVNETNALTLFNSLIFSEEPIDEIVTKKITPIDYLTTKFDGKVKEHFLVNRVVTFADIPELLVPVKVDLIGKNGIDVFVQSIDMTANESKIINEISTFYLLKQTYKKNKKECQDFVLTQEPSQNYTKQHLIWEQLRSSNEFNYVDTSEVDKIIEYAEKNNVKPIFGRVENDDFELDQISMPF